MRSDDGDRYKLYVCRQRMRICHLIFTGEWRAKQNHKVFGKLATPYISICSSTKFISFFFFFFFFSIFDDNIIINVNKGTIFKHTYTGATAVKPRASLSAQDEFLAINWCSMYFRYTNQMSSAVCARLSVCVLIYDSNMPSQTIHRPLLNNSRHRCATPKPIHKYDRTSGDFGDTIEIYRRSNMPID